jgi:arylsulfatase A
MRIHTPGIAVGILLLAACTTESASGADRPNILLILADDAGMGDLGCYGGRLLNTPNIDGLAAGGMRFTDAYSGASVCAPSRCALMTGRHMGRATIRGNWEVFPEGQAPLKEDEVTVAMVLREAGYATGICGKWGLGGPGSGSEPNDKGFDFFFGYNCQRHAHRYVTDYLYRNRARIEIDQAPDRPINAHTLIAQESLDFIRRNRERPWFLFCAWTLPHGIHRIDQVPDVSAYAGRGWTDTQKVYAAMVEWLDADVGRLLALLDELGLERNTLVIFASDNGGLREPELSEHFGSRAGMRGAKGDLWEGGIRVPMIARWPSRIPAGRTTGQPVAFWDLLPTVAELAGAKCPPGIDGDSIVPMLLGEPQDPSRPLYWEQFRRNRLEQALRMESWKAHRAAPDEPLELYDLKGDPAETTDVAAEHPESVAKIEAIMAGSRVEIEIPKPDPRVWEKYREDLRKLDEKLGWPGAAAP